MALGGVSNRRSFEDFETLFNKHDRQHSEMPLLAAATLLGARYAGPLEAEKIATFLANLDREIPYSPLVFHSDFMMSDLPATPYRQVQDCYRAAKKHLTSVNIGNLATLGIRSWKV
jgi:pyruvate formate lyase activating enzyme